MTIHDLFMCVCFYTVWLLILKTTVFLLPHYFCSFHSHCPSPPLLSFFLLSDSVFLPVLYSCLVGEEILLFCLWSSMTASRARQMWKSCVCMDVSTWVYMICITQCFEHMLKASLAEWASLSNDVCVHVS